MNKDITTTRSLVNQADSDDDSDYDEDEEEVPRKDIVVFFSSDREEKQSADVKCGWLSKCGHVRRNWRRRWFVLDNGELRYYKTPLHVFPYGIDLKGEIHLDHFAVALKVDGGSKFDVFNVLEKGNSQSIGQNLFRKDEHTVLEIDAGSNETALEWIDAINNHISFYFASKKHQTEKDVALAEGWLDRKVKTPIKKWQRRWFVLRTNKLEYYVDDTCGKLLGQLHLHSAVRVMTRDGFRRRHKFAVMSKTNRLELSCLTETERREWMKTIQGVCKKDDDENEVDDDFRASTASWRATEDFSDMNINIHANTGEVKLDEASVSRPESQPGDIDTETQTHNKSDSNYSQLASATKTGSKDKLDAQGQQERDDALTEELMALISAKDHERQNLTMEVLRKQLLEKGEKPLEFIPLDELQEEVSTILKKVNNGESFDEGRLEYLLHCLELNPEHQEKLAKEKAQWREEVKPYAEQCFNEMRGYIPSHVFDASIMTLVDDDGLSKSLAKRFFMKKCLMLVRLREDDISKMHIAELSGRFNPLAQGLDIVEMAAIYHALPESFLNDHNGKKEQWRNGVEEAFKKMYAQKKSNSLSKNAVRYGGYLKEIPLFTDDDSYHSFSKEHSSTDNSEDFLRLSRQKNGKREAKRAQQKNIVETTQNDSMPARANPFGNELRKAISMRRSAKDDSSIKAEEQEEQESSSTICNPFQAELKRALRSRKSE